VSGGHAMSGLVAGCQPGFTRLLRLSAGVCCGSTRLDSSRARAVSA
jgi:hypothetical protein